MVGRHHPEMNDSSSTLLMFVLANGTSFLESLFTPSWNIFLTLGLVETSHDVKLTNGETSVLDGRVTSHSSSDVESEMRTERQIETSQRHKQLQDESVVVLNNDNDQVLNVYQRRQEGKVG